MVGERGFEPPTPWSRTRCSTRLSHSPNDEAKNCSRSLGTINALQAGCEISVRSSSGSNRREPKHPTRRSRKSRLLFDFTPIPAPMLPARSPQASLSIRTKQIRSRSPDLRFSIRRHRTTSTVASKGFKSRSTTSCPPTNFAFVAVTAPVCASQVSAALPCDGTVTACSFSCAPSLKKR